VRLAEIVFWGSLATGLYVYGLYPLLVWLMSRWTRDPVADGRGADGPAADSELRPSVTLLITARRDEQVIVERLNNALALDYPARRLQILVGCIGEDDLTGLLARSFDKRQIEVIQFPKGGEAAALNACVRQASGEIIVFSDARTMMLPDAIRQLAGHFSDPAVGGVCGKLAVVDPTSGRVLNRRASRFENFLERCEIRLGAFPEVNRGIYAIRRELFLPLTDKRTVNDFLIAMRVHRQGYRLLYDESAVATADVSLAADDSQRGRRTRTEAFRRLRMLWPLTDFGRGGISFVFCLNKELRYFGPGLLIVAFVSNACLSDDPFYLHCFLLHELFYVAALIGLFFIAEGRWQQLRQAPARSLFAIGAPFRGLFCWISGRGRKPVETDATRVSTHSTL
jgi:cellulose synthase/poly-beta-1,6-N-acetylglucosamine synthase-like glycosyltransferase